jgi:hypothetical protein
MYNKLLRKDCVFKTVHEMLFKACVITIKKVYFAVCVFYVTSRYVLGCLHRRSNFQCTEHLQVCPSVHTFFDVRIWKCFMTGTVPFLYLRLLATHRCQWGSSWYKIHPGILPHRFLLHSLHLTSISGLPTFCITHSYKFCLIYTMILWRNLFLFRYLIKFQIVIKHEIKFLIQSFGFLPY